MTRYRIKTRVEKIERRRKALRARVINKETKEIQIEYEDLGWFVVFENSYEGLSLGSDDPVLKEGQRADILIIPITEEEEEKKDE